MNIRKHHVSGLQKFHAKHNWKCSNKFFHALGKVVNQPSLKPVATV